MESGCDFDKKQSGLPGRKQLHFLSKEDKAARKRERNRKAQIKYRLLRKNDQDFKTQQLLYYNKRRQKRLSLSKEELEIERKKDAARRRKERNALKSAVKVFIETEFCDIKTDPIDEHLEEIVEPDKEKNYEDFSLNEELNLASEQLEPSDIKIEDTKVNYIDDLVDEKDNRHSFEIKATIINSEQNEGLYLKRDNINNVVQIVQTKDSIKARERKVRTEPFNGSKEQNDLSIDKARKRERNRKYQAKHRLLKGKDYFKKYNSIRRKKKRLSLSREELEMQRKKDASRRRKERKALKSAGKIFTETEFSDIKAEEIVEPDVGGKYEDSALSEESNLASEQFKTSDIKVEDKKVNYIDDLVDEKDDQHSLEIKATIINSEQNECLDLKGDNINNEAEKAQTKDSLKARERKLSTEQFDGSKDENVPSIEEVRKRERNRKYQAKHRLLKGQDYFKKYNSIRRKKKRLSLSNEELEVRRKKEAAKRKYYRSLKKYGYGDNNNEPAGEKKKKSFQEVGEPIQTKNYSDSQSLDLDNFENHYLKEDGRREIHPNIENIDFSDMTKNGNSGPTDENSGDQNRESRYEHLDFSDIKNNFTGDTSGSNNDHASPTDCKPEEPNEEYILKARKLERKREYLERKRKYQAKYMLLIRQDPVEMARRRELRRKYKAKYKILKSLDPLERARQLELNRKNKAEQRLLKSQDPFEIARQRELNRKTQAKFRLLKGQDILEKDRLRRKKKRLSLSKEELEVKRKKEALKQKKLRDLKKTKVREVDGFREGGINILNFEEHKMSVKEKMAKLSGENGHYWTCLECPYTSKNKNNLFSHIESHHFKNIKYDCIMCESSHPKDAALSFHVRRKHRKNKEKQDQTKTSLQNKKYGDRRKKCEICEKKFNKSETFDKHMRHGHESKTNKEKSNALGSINLQGPLGVETCIDIIKTFARNLKK